MDFYLTAYDPSDLPGTSIDPLGFERGYLFLADKILPGMTNVAGCPRYFGVLCAGIHLSNTSNDISSKKQREFRRLAIMRLERIWALANVIAAGGNDNLSGLRGVTYAQRQAEQLATNGTKKSIVDFPLLSRQGPYGAIGIYGAVAGYIHLLYPGMLELRPQGMQLAESFICETEMPSAIQRAVHEGGELSVSLLRSWGEKAFLWGTSGENEGQCYYDMVHNDPIRSRFTKLLERKPFIGEENELSRLARIVDLTARSGDADLAEAVQGILYYEECYKWFTAVLKRLLFLCRANSGSIGVDMLASDPGLEAIKKRLPGVVRSFDTHITTAETPHFLNDLHEHLGDMLSFMNKSAISAKHGLGLVESIVERHTDVQHGKFDRGRRKAPWLEWRGDYLLLTTNLAPDESLETIKPENITPHFYRLDAADAWIAAASSH